MAQKQRGSNTPLFDVDTEDLGGGMFDQVFGRFQTYRRLRGGLWRYSYSYNHWYHIISKVVVPPEFDEEDYRES